MYLQGLSKLLINQLYDSNIDTFIINAGIGDFIQFDSLVNQKIRNNIKTIVFWNPYDPTNPKADLMETMIKSNKYYSPDVKIIKIKIRTNSFNLNNNKLISIEKEIINSHNIDPNKTFNQNKLLNETLILKNFDIIREKSIENKAKSSYLLEEISNIKQFNIPEKYCVIVPTTSHDRQFTSNDYYETFSILENFLKIKGILISQSNLNIKNDNIINLSGKIGIHDSIEIMKNSQGYIGIDSYLSIIACQVIKTNKIIIKSNNNLNVLTFFYYMKKNVKTNIFKSINYKNFLTKNAKTYI